MFEKERYSTSSCTWIDIELLALFKFQDNCRLQNTSEKNGIWVIAKTTNPCQTSKGSVMQENYEDGGS